MVSLLKTVISSRAQYKLFFYKIRRYYIFFGSKLFSLFFEFHSLVLSLKMEKITLRQIIMISLIPNIFITVWLVLIWGRGELHTAQVWRNAPSVSRAVLYLSLTFIVYFGIMSWICFLLIIVADSFPKACTWLNPVIDPDKPSRLLLSFWIGVLGIEGFLAVPFVMTRAHVVHSVLMELGQIGYLFGLLFATLSAYGFLWNLFGRGERN